MTAPKKPESGPASRRPADVVALPSKQLAKNVARELASQQRRRKLLLLLLLAAAIALAVTYGTCGRGWGLGKGKGEGSGSGPGPGSAQGVMAMTIDAGPTRCSLRLTAAGITVDGKSMTREEAITACKATTGVDLVIDGTAEAGERDDLKTALQEAKVEWVELKPGGGGSASGSAGSASPGSAGSDSATPSGSSGSGSSGDVGPGSSAPEGTGSSTMPGSAAPRRGNGKRRYRLDQGNPLFDGVQKTKVDVSPWCRDNPLARECM